MRKIIFIILFLGVVKSQAANPDSLFLKATNLYINEQYDSTIVLLDSIITLGYESDQVYYNLGNSYYQKGNIPMSILFFEKSLVINSKNIDALVNLEIANKRVSLIEELPTFILLERWYNFVNLFSINFWSVILLILVWLFCLTFFLFLQNKKKIIFNALLFLIFLNVISISALKTKIEDNKQVFGIFIENAELYEQANITSSSSNIGQGNKALILDENNDWLFVELKNGSKGWIKIESLLNI